MSALQKAMGLGLAILVGVELSTSLFAADADVDAVRLTKELGGADSRRLMAYLEGQIPSEQTTKRLTRLIAAMGDPSFRVREDAMQCASLMPDQSLCHCCARPRRTTMKRSPPGPGAGIDKIQQGDHFDLPIVAIRELAKQKESKAFGVVLRFLPNVVEESFREDVIRSLSALAVAGNTVDPA